MNIEQNVRCAGSVVMCIWSVSTLISYLIQKRKSIKNIQKALHYTLTVDDSVSRSIRGVFPYFIFQSVKRKWKKNTDVRFPNFIIIAEWVLCNTVRLLDNLHTINVECMCWMFPLNRKYLLARRRRRKRRREKYSVCYRKRNKLRIIDIQQVAVCFVETLISWRLSCWRYLFFQFEDVFHHS